MFGAGAGPGREAGPAWLSWEDLERYAEKCARFSGGISLQLARPN